MWLIDWKENFCLYGNGSYVGYICRFYYILLLIMVNMGIVVNIFKIWYVCNYR